MKRIISLLLCIVMLCTVIINTVSCESEPIGSIDTPDDTEKQPESDSPEDDNGNIISPPHRDYGREAVNFNDISYTRPNTESLIDNFRSTVKIISECTLPYNEQLEAIRSLENGYSEFHTMLAYANIMKSRNSADEYWIAEYDHLSSCEPELVKVTEELFVAAASSEYFQKFESDYFGEGELDEYRDGGKYTDALVSLLEEENALENRYSALSTTTVTITYNGVTDTTESHLTRIDAEFADNESTRDEARNLCLAAYQKKYNEEAKAILVSLVKLRSRIAQEYGYESYAEVAYEQFNRDYSTRDATKFIENLAKYILPIYLKLNYSVFLPYFNSVGEEAKADATDVINSLYHIYENTDETLHTAYSYMLEYGFYDYSESDINRFAGSFTTYLKDYDAPYVFISAVGAGSDYMTLAHEFGHFYDSYINYGADTSLDLSEVSSISLEFITLLGLADTLDEEAYRYLYYTAIESAMRALIFQGYYALFEHYAYEIPYNMINEKTLSLAASKAAMDIGLPTMLTLDSVLIPHTLLYPFYVQSYCTATAVALEIFYTERENEGDGLQAYKSLVLRETEGLPFLEELNEARLTSPFSTDTVKKLADKIHFDLLGSHYYHGADHENNAA